jgi:cytochrome c biogenesis protein CcmG/thiol:disulfide interchange protein DsbE
VAIDFGLYGVPETYLIDRTGIVRWRYAGALTPTVVGESLVPLLRRYA